MATHSSTLASGIPWTEERGGLQSMGSLSRTRLERLSTHAHMTFKAQRKLKITWAKKERSLRGIDWRYIQLTWIIWLEEDHLEMIYKGLVQKQQQQAYLRP